MSVHFGEMAKELGPYPGQALKGETIGALMAVFW
jgi:hypothetical protein